MLTKRNYLFGTTVLAGVLMAATPTLAEVVTAPQNQTRSQAQSQDDEEEDAQLEEVIVTGSRISRPQYEGTIPGVQVGEQDIEERLFTNAGDILNDVPLVGAGSSLNGNNGGQTASLGVTFIDLLNLGTARTLTLVNGRRFVSNNSATIFVAGNETGSQVDASTIPVALINRVDILTVGGAATYGADAVSGVVNYILKDDYEGAEITIIGGQTFEYNDAARFSVNATYGTNLMDDRLNVAVSGEYSFIDSLRAIDRDYRADGPNFISNPRNGAQRNPDFVPLGTATPFINAALDGIAGTVRTENLRGVTTGFGGLIFNPTASNGAAENPTIAALPTGSAVPLSVAQFQPGNVFRNPGFAQIAPFGYSFQSALQQVPGTPFGTCVYTAAQGCALAPASIANLTAAQIAAERTRYGLPGTATTAQVLAVIQANRPTAREYYAANPNTPINAFLGTFVPGIPDIANTGASSSVLPRLGVPLRFDAAGNVVTFNYAGALATDPTAPGTSGSADGGDGSNRVDTTHLRVEQERWVGNLIAHYDVTDSISFFTENLYSDITARVPISTGGLFNGITSSAPENAGILVNVNHPLLTAANRTALAAAGITGNFIVSRFNEDVINDLSQESTNETIRSVNGFRGDFDLFGRSFGWEVSHTYGKAETHVEFSAINDVAYALAIDAVQVGANVQCRVQRDGIPAYLASYGGGTGNTPFVPGAITQPISRIGADGVREQVLFTPTVTAEMAAACVPLNIFGEGRASQAAKDFVSVRNFFNNESTQNFTQAILTGDVFDLPAGPLQFAISGEIRKEELSYTVDEITRQGRTRSAPSATTNAEVEALEYGLELNIPILGNGFDLPFVQALEFNPSIRWTQLDGSGERYRNLAGTLISPEYSGDREEIYTLAGTWTVNDQLLLRGNISKSVRNPSIVELFLGNQPFFTSIGTDPCSATAFRSGANAANRERNCIAEVQRIAALNGGALTGGDGVSRPITNAAQALAFITGTGGYTPTGSSFTGLISGRQTLVPERGDSFTFGFVAQPSVIPNLIVAADYLEITVEDAIGPLLAANAAQFCYDSAAYPDNTVDIGTNSCSGIQRDSTFNFTNGFELPYFNLGATRVKAINANLSYSMDLSDVFSSDMDLGTLAFRGNAYYLLEYTTSAIGDFTDATPSENSFANPTWKSQGSVIYDRGPLNLRWTTSFTDATIVRSGVTQATLDQATVTRRPAYALHTFSVGYDVMENLTARVVIDNVTDEDTIGQDGLYNADYADFIGRRWTASLTYEF